MAQTLTYTAITLVGWVGDHPLIQPYAKTAAVIGAGDLVALSSGSIVEASTNPTAVVGVAMNAGTNSLAGTFDGLSSLTGSIENTGVHVAMASTQNIFEGNLSGVLSTTVPQPGLTYGMTLDATTDLWYIDNTKSGANQICVIYKVYNDKGHGQLGDTGARVQFQFIPADTVLAT